MSLLKRFAHSPPTNRRHRKHLKVDFDDDMGFFSHPSSSAQLLSAPSNPPRKLSSASARPRDDVDEFLSSDLELSFASTVSLNSPSRSEYEPMDISPVPFCKVVTRPKNDDMGSKPSTRPRAFTSAATRGFGNDVSNEISANPLMPQTKPDTIQTKRIQRSALPSEWLAFSRLKQDKRDDENDMPTTMPPCAPDSSGDAMDIDSETSLAQKQFYPTVPQTNAPETTTLGALFHETMSPRLSQESLPNPPRKRRSVSPHAVRAVDDSILSSPGLELDSSPSQRKFERISSGPLLNRLSKPTLQGLGNPQTAALKKPRRLAISAVLQPSDASPIYCTSANAVLSDSSSRNREDVPPARRAFSALLPPTGFALFEQLSDESSFDGPELSSPAQAYTKRQQVKTIRRRDGTDDLRPLTGATAIVQNGIYESPRSKYLAPGLGGFGDNEAHGKILPCHRVKEDGLMRIRCETLDDLLDGVFDSQITNYLIIDCRFDYEYDGGHIPGAINIKTPAALEEHLLGASTTKPPPCMSGDRSRKSVLVFHCEFSAKRAPTFAKQLRARDRAMNNHVYPNIHYPEVYILEGGYCQYFKHAGARCQPPAYVPMDDPRFVVSRNEDLDQFRKAKFGRYKSYTYGDGPFKSLYSQQPSQAKRNSAPTTAAPVPLFAVANVARTRRAGGLSSLPEDGNSTVHSDNEDTDIGDSPCPPPTKNNAFKAKKLGRGPLARAETYGPIKLAY